MSLLLALGTTSTPGAELWPVGEAVPLAVRQGRAECWVPSQATHQRTLVIVSALARPGGTAQVSIQATAAGVAAAPLRVDDGPVREPWRCAAPAVFEPSPVDHPPLPMERRFNLPVRNGDLASPDTYEVITAVLRGEVRRVCLYVDTRDLHRVGPGLVQDALCCLDEHVLPVAERLWGPAGDVDGDGRFTILVTSALGRLDGGRHRVDGCVRAADFDGRLGAPFGNATDMMYLNAALEAGPFLRTVIAHEYTHAVTISRKSQASVRPGRQVLEEEAWLDESIAHVVEDLHGFSRANLDHRVEAFLRQPERYSLLVADYHRADLFRSHGHRGAAYLFLRSCEEGRGQDLLRSLVLSPRRGVLNLETATGASFERLYRAWTVGLCEPLIRPVTRGGIAGMDAPRTRSVRLGEPPVAVTLQPATTAYVVVDGCPDGAVGIRVTGPASAGLQVTALRLPLDLPRLLLDARPVGAGSERRVRLLVRDQDPFPVRLSRLSIGDDRDPRDGGAAPSPTRAWTDPAELLRLFGALEVGGRSQLESIEVPCPAGLEGGLLVRLVGVDQAGRRVVADARCGPPPGPVEPTFESPGVALQLPLTVP